MVIEFETNSAFTEWTKSNGGTTKRPLTLGPNLGYIKETNIWIIQTYKTDSNTGETYPTNQKVSISYFLGKSINEPYVADFADYYMKNIYVPGPTETDPIYSADRETLVNQIVNIETRVTRIDEQLEGVNAALESI